MMNARGIVVDARKRVQLTREDLMQPLKRPPVRD